MPAIDRRLRMSPETIRLLATSVRQMWDAGLSSSTIAERLNVSQQAARELLRGSFRAEDGEDEDGVLGR